jgi:hypothetical protein
MNPEQAAAVAYLFSLRVVVPKREWREVVEKQLRVSLVTSFLIALIIQINHWCLVFTCQFRHQE